MSLPGVLVTDWISRYGCKYVSTFRKQASLSELDNVDSILVPKVMGLCEARALRLKWKA